MATVNDALKFVQDPHTPKVGLSFNGKVVGNGEHIPKAETHVTPTLTLPTPSGVYIVVCIDLDAPFPSFSFLGPILHWFQSGLRASASSTPSTSGDSIGTQLTALGIPHIVDYAGAGPPPGSGPHRYIFLLYQQSGDFDASKHAVVKEGQKVGISKRIKYDFAALVRDAKLGEPVAGNWFISN
ncbi:hypothetical protein LTR09_009679 [Extremus antarcticus]|uniref:PEBP-like protein n=1 Tax=Extremus antarcticus TaxID=702011 RepID=A0AAJ0G920_9PEZI|nr:hypothetical protein LTR09_009679 [Extremus antarcticus]